MAVIPENLNGQGLSMPETLIVIIDKQKMT